MTRKLLFGAVVMLALSVALVGIGTAAAKSYQFTGTVKTVTGTTFTVEKSATETWEFSTDKDTKGAPAADRRPTADRRRRSAMSDRVVVITGASSGIGAALAEELGQRGDSVVLVARREAELRQVASRSGAKAGRAYFVRQTARAKA